MKPSEVLTEIECADDALIHDIIRAVMRRYQMLFPDWEMCFFSLPKNDPECRKAYAEQIAKMISGSSVVEEIATPECALVRNDTEN